MAASGCRQVGRCLEGDGVRVTGHRFSPPEQSGTLADARTTRRSDDAFELEPWQEDLIKRWFEGKTEVLQFGQMRHSHRLRNAELAFYIAQHLLQNDEGTVAIVANDYESAQRQFKYVKELLELVDLSHYSERIRVISHDQA